MISPIFAQILLNLTAKSLRVGAESLRADGLRQLALLLNAVAERSRQQVAHIIKDVELSAGVDQRCQSFYLNLHVAQGKGAFS